MNLAITQLNERSVGKVDDLLFGLFVAEVDVVAAAAPVEFADRVVAAADSVTRALEQLSQAACLCNGVTVLDKTDQIPARLGAMQSTRG